MSGHSNEHDMLSAPFLTSTNFSPPHRGLTARMYPRLQLMDLPPELLPLIIRHLDNRELLNCRSACSTLRNAIDNRTPWRLSISPRQMSFTMIDEIYHDKSFNHGVYRPKLDIRVLSMGMPYFSNSTKYYQTVKEQEVAVNKLKSTDQRQWNTDTRASRYDLRSRTYQRYRTAYREREDIIKTKWMQMIRRLFTLTNLGKVHVTLVTFPTSDEIPLSERKVYTDIGLLPISTPSLIDRAFRLNWRIAATCDYYIARHFPLPLRYTNLHSLQIVYRNTDTQMTLDDVCYGHEETCSGRWTSAWTQDFVRDEYSATRTAMLSSLNNKRLLTFLSRQTQLQVVNLRFIPGAYDQIPFDQLTPFLRALGPNLRSLSLTGCHISSAGFDDFIARHPALSKLKLNAWIDRDTSVDLATALATSSWSNAGWYKAALDFMNLVRGRREWDLCEISTCDPTQEIHAHWTMCRDILIADRKISFRHRVRKDALYLRSLRMRLRSEEAFHYRLRGRLMGDNSDPDLLYIIVQHGDSEKWKKAVIDCGRLLSILKSPMVQPTTVHI